MFVYLLKVCAYVSVKSSTFIIKERLLVNFKLFEVSKPAAFTQNAALFKSLTIAERFFLTELILSKQLFQKHNISFDFDQAFDEVQHILANLLEYVECNSLFFENLESAVYDIIDNPLYKNKFFVKTHLPLHTLYTVLLVKSLYFVENVSSTDITADAYLHRNVVISNLKKHSRVFSYLGSNIGIVDNSLKIIMLLSQFFKHKKIVMYFRTRYKTDFYLKFNIIFEQKHIDRIELQYSLIPYRTVVDFQIGASYLTLAKIFKRNSYQPFTNKIDVSAIIKLNTKPVYIHHINTEVIIDKIVENIIAKYNFNSCKGASFEKVKLLIDELINLKNSKLNSITCKRVWSALDNNHRTLIEKHLIDAGDNLNIIDFEQTNELIRKFGNTLNSDFLKNINTTYIYKLKEDISNIDATIQSLYYTILIYKTKSLSYPIYHSFFYDFRGRLYPYSTIGFAYLKNIRPYFTLKQERLLQLSELEKSVYYNKIINSRPKLTTETLAHLKTNLDKYLTYVCYMEIGKLFKKTINSENGITASQFIELGENIYYNQQLYAFNDVADFSYFLNIKNCLDNFFITNTWLNINIIRDSTASTFQHWGVFLKLKPEYYKFFNVDGDVWYDTYSVIILFFKKQYSELCEAPELQPLLNRDALKKIIMIVNYNAGLWECNKHLIEYITNNNLLINSELQKKFINTFHKFLSVDLFSLIYTLDKDLTVKGFGNRLSLMDGMLDLNYNDVIKKKKELTVSNIRWLYTTFETTSVFSQWRTNVAINANMVHAGDAELARWLIVRINLWPVHDSFCVSIFDTHKLMDTTNEYFQIKYGNSEQYSAFILI